MKSKPMPAKASSSLGNYYFLRATISIAWVAAAFTIGKTMPIAGVLLVVYPAWDALANAFDAQRNGGFGKNLSQTLNMIVSILTAVAMSVAVSKGMHAVAAVFGTWAIIAGLLQLITAVRRWRAGAQWTMVLSGAQSALAGGYFASLALKPALPAITSFAGYAGVGAVYFLIAGILLTLFKRRDAEAVPNA